MKYFERILWGLIVLALVAISATDPWFRNVWYWWVLGLGVSFMAFGIGYGLGHQRGWLSGQARGYRTAMKTSRGLR